MSTDLRATQEAIKDLNKNYHRPGIPPLKISDEYRLLRDYPKHYWPGQGQGKTSGGVYLFFDDENNLLYVGKARNLAVRLSQYFRQDTDGKAEPTSEKSEGTASVRTIALPKGHEFEAGAIEMYLVERLDPPRNKKRG
ncbi:MAG: GIY-YIG nuclease family protein [Candidatus Woesearchaeota archaeon]